MEMKEEAKDGMGNAYRRLHLPIPPPDEGTILAFKAWANVCKSVKADGCFAKILLLLKMEALYTG